MSSNNTSPKRGSLWTTTLEDIEKVPFPPEAEIEQAMQRIKKENIMSTHSEIADDEVKRLEKLFKPTSF